MHEGFSCPDLRRHKLWLAGLKAFVFANRFIVIMYNAISAISGIDLFAVNFIHTVIQSQSSMNPVVFLFYFLVFCFSNLRYFPFLFVLNGMGCNYRWQMLIFQALGLSFFTKVK